MNKTVGKFDFHLGGPYPCWLSVQYGNTSIHGIRHDDLPDLIYGLQQMKKEAEKLTGESL